MIHPYDGSLVLPAAFGVLGGLGALLWMAYFWGAKRSWGLMAGLAVLAVMLGQLWLTQNGVVRLWERRPPPMMLMIAICFLFTIAAAVRFSGVLASQLSFAFLIGVQAFRLPLELAMHEAASAGIMPRAMSYSGYNFDVVTGTTAIIVAALAAAGRAPRWLLLGWNLMGSILLAVIVGIAVAATPLFYAFGYDQANTFIGYAPFIWLPGMLVPLALFGHIVIWRKLARRA